MPFESLRTKILKTPVYSSISTELLLPRRFVVSRYNASMTSYMRGGNNAGPMVSLLLGSVLAETSILIEIPRINFIP